MSSTINKAFLGTPGQGLLDLGLVGTDSSSRRETDLVQPATCFHCGDFCRDGAFTKAGKAFCCQGCLTVHEILAANGLEQFYQIARSPGVRVRRQASREHWAHLDQPAVQSSLLDFTDGKTSRVTFHVPAIHCVACVWLLENLFRLHPGIGKSQVHFPRREVAIRFASDQLALSELAALLASIGYKPKLTLGELGKNSQVPAPGARRRWLQLGIAGFAFGNIMLFSLPVYFGLDSFSGPIFKTIFGYLSLALALPVLFYSASDYWRSAFLSVRQRVLTLDVPIALGLAALYLQSAAEIISGRGEGYLDSLAGLVFFLLCGKAFQQKTFERIAFDLDYKSFFPLAVIRKTAAGEQTTSISELSIGDRLVIRNGELIPADSTLVSGEACIDYGFVTGESEPVARGAGDHLYAGGRQIGHAIEVEIVKEVSQSYLTSLWNHETFRKPRGDDLNTLTNRYARRFTRAVIAVAAAAALFWCLSGQGARGLKAFTSVLIVACPCALALAAPFALGTAQRLLARLSIFLRNPLVLERLARVDTIVFDKTGTLTSPQANDLSFQAAGAALSKQERAWLHSLAGQSTHPHSVRIRDSLRNGDPPHPVSSFCEIVGKGVTGVVAGHEVKLGSAAWLRGHGLELPKITAAAGSASYVAIDRKIRGAFALNNALRPRARELVAQLGSSYELALLSGDNEKQRANFRELFGSDAHLHFNQSPFEKLDFVRKLQAQGRMVMMVGDGLNDAGALKQSDPGVAVVEEIGAFSPASDVILRARDVWRLPHLLEFSRASARTVRWSFLISGLYNAVGISIAAAGILSPVICAVLMPLSSISVVLFACGAANWAARQTVLNRNDAVEFGERARPGRCQPAPSPVGGRAPVITEPWAQLTATGVAGKARTDARAAGAPPPTASSRLNTSEV